MAQQPTPQPSFPALRLTESKDYVTVQAVVPGFAESDLDITLANDVLCIAGRQRAVVPGGFTARHRGRRGSDFRSEIKLLNEVAWDDTEGSLGARCAHDSLAQGRAVLAPTHPHPFALRENP